MANNRVIGNKGKIPWHMPRDLKRFRDLTIFTPMLMGRKTWESLPGLLFNREHIVLTRDPDYFTLGITVVDSIDAALDYAENDPELMIIGGGSLYKAMMPMAHCIYLSEIDVDVEGDTYFPDIDMNEWIEFSRKTYPADEKNPYDCTFTTLIRSGAI